MTQARDLLGHRTMTSTIPDLGGCGGGGDGRGDGLGDGQSQGELELCRGERRRLQGGGGGGSF